MSILPCFCGFFFQPTKIEVLTDALYLLVPALIVGATLLITAITKLVQTISRAELFNVSLTPTQIVEFTNAESVTLYSETPMFSSAPSLKCELRGLENNQLVESYPAISFVKSSGGDGQRRALRTFALKEPGKYQLTIEGLEANHKYNDTRLIFTRPHNGKVFLWLLGIILSGMLTMFSFVMTIIAIQPK